MLLLPFQRRLRTSVPAHGRSVKGGVDDSLRIAPELHSVLGPTISYVVWYDLCFWFSVKIGSKSHDESDSGVGISAIRIERGVSSGYDQNL